MKAMSYETIIPETGIRYTWCEDYSLEELLSYRKEILEGETFEEYYKKAPDKLSTILSGIL